MCNLMRKFDSFHSEVHLDPRHCHSVNVPHVACLPNPRLPLYSIIPLSLNSKDIPP